MYVKVFGRGSITELDWDTVVNGSALRAFYEPVVEHSSKVFVRNSNHRVEVLQVNDRLYPLTLGAKTKRNSCYLFSFLAQYIDYTREEVLHGDKYSASQKIAAKLFFPILRILGDFLGMERVVFVNNFFLATNLYEKESPVTHPLVPEYLKKHYPKRAIVYRSVNDSTDIRIFQKLRRQGGIPLACRQLYILDPQNSNYAKKRPVIQDRKLWERTTDVYWENVSEFLDKETELLLSYYHRLYREKYAALNPDYTPAFLKAMLSSHMLHYSILREKTSLWPLAVQAVVKTGEQLCTPFIGYDWKQPRERGLYRLMNYQLVQMAVAEKKILNMSSGASDFKKQRGGVPCFDYHIVFMNHLPKRKQWIWKKLYAYSESTIKPTMKRLKV
ncbi:hypothetical protein [Ulvibacterium sp.]|uniref:hypothetical protein n=1 Tax=Ulvibacterium sp. TaxID=2665914 RepID=UPI003CC683C1